MNDGWTALNVACHNGHTDIAAALILRNATLGIFEETQHPQASVTAPGTDDAVDARVFKTALDGGIEEAPDNVVIYATSNRRYLMPSLHSDNAGFQWIDDEVHAGESTEEKISLSERFGLWLSFLAFNQDNYLQMVQHHLSKLGYNIWDDRVRGESLRWAQTRASRSGRVAHQFARDWAGKHH